MLEVLPRALDLLETQVPEFVVRGDVTAVEMNTREFGSCEWEVVVEIVVFCSVQSWCSRLINGPDGPSRTAWHVSLSRCIWQHLADAS